MPTSLSQFTTDRATAGAAYAAAANALVNAYVELSALDMTLANAAVAQNAYSLDAPTLAGLLGSGPFAMASASSVRGFSGGIALPYHEPFLSFSAPDTGAGASDRIRTRLAALLSTYASPVASAAGSALVTANASRATARATVAGLRATAGATYAAAAASLATAYVELAAYDRVLANSLIGGGQQTAFSDSLRIPLHAEFLPTVAAHGGLSARISDRFAQLLATA